MINLDVSNFRGPPPLSSKQAFVRAVFIVDQMPLLPTLQSVLDRKKQGRPGEMPIRAFVVSALYYALMRPKDDMHLTKVNNAILQMSPSMKWELGLRKVPTYRKTHLAFTRLARLFDGTHVPSPKHRVVDKETGEVRPCAEDCPHWESNAPAFLNQMLDASCSPHAPDSADFAIDSTAYETWARILFVRREPANGQGTPEQKANEQSVLEAEGEADSMRSPTPPIDAAKPGSYERQTKDPDAHEGYRTASNNERGRTFWGYDLHSLTNVSTDQTVIPHMVRSAAIAPAGSDTTTKAGLMAIDAYSDVGRKEGSSHPAIRQLLADRGYSQHDAKEWQLPLQARRITQVFDLKETQRGQRPGPIDGTISIDGGIFVDALPERLRHIPPITRRTTDAERKVIAALRDEMLAYAFSPSSAVNPTTGTQRFKGPVVRGKLRCPNNPRSLRGPHKLPLTACKPGCACSKTITVGPDYQARERQWPLYQTTDWIKSYGRRTAIESVNAEIKHHRADFKRGYTHVFGLVKISILVTYGLAATNVHILRDWHFNRDQQDPWTAHHDAAGWDEEHWDFGRNPRKTRAPRRQKLESLTRRRTTDG